MRKLFIALTTILTACGGTAQLHLELGANSSAATAQQALTDGTPLAGAKSVTVTVTEVSVHLAGEGGTGDDETENESDAGVPTADAGSTTEAESNAGWRVVSSTEQTFDLVALQSNATAPLGDAELPAGKVTQIRLALKAPESRDGAAVIPGAVVDADGQTCDLIVPQSAVKPGLKIAGVFKLDAGSEREAVVNLRLQPATREDTASGCAYRLNPVISITHFGERPAADADHPTRP